ncbi:MAG: MerR family transcriptional regulator [Anaerolineae bacterium]|nr:MerR family transcriptional regulator [Anaerolineae bacterium]
MPRRKVFRTSDVARAGGVHTNTVRLYEAWGYLAPADRAPNGYRQFTAYHLDQIKVIRWVLHATWFSPTIRRVALDVIFQSAAHDLTAALESAQQLHALVLAEQTHAEATVTVLEQWASGTAFPDPLPAPLRIGEVAQLLAVSVDMLRNWERNGLLSVPRDPANGYRQYGPTEIARLRVIRALRRAKYSTMAILRMLHQLDAGTTNNLRAALNTPDPDDDSQHATDRWLTTLAEAITALEELLPHLHMMLRTHGA